TSYHFPTTGLSPEIPPNGNARSWPAPVPSNDVFPFASSTQKNPARNTPTLLLPSPFQSPATGTSPGIPPKANAWSPPARLTSSKVPLPFVSRIQKKPSRNKPSLERPSPFQSPTTGTSPLTPPNA